MESESGSPPPLVAEGGGSGGSGAGGPRFDPCAPGLTDDPYPVYRRFRERDPIHRGLPPIPSLPRCTYLFRHEDVVAALGDDRFGRRRGPEALAALDPSEAAGRVILGIARRMLLFSDPPEHARRRACLERALLAPSLRRLPGQLPEIAHALLDATEGDAVDLMADFAAPLPVLAIAEAMGLPREDWPELKTWSTRIVSILDVRRTNDVLEETARATRSLALYLRDRLEERRRRPGDDLLTALLEAAETGPGLTDDEVLANAVLLVSAGHETTVNLIGNGVLALLRHPDEMARLSDHPELLDSAVEELLRFDSPVQMTFRVAHEPVEIGGERVEAGEGVVAVLGSANRDPGVFRDPDLLDVGRDHNPHVAFSAGIHACLGQSLGRLEARVALGTLLSRLGGLRLDGEPERTSHTVLRGLRRLPVRWG